VVVVSGVPRVFQFDRDPKDEPYINLAIAAQANYLVSRDNDILDLVDASTPDGQRLRHKAPELQIVEPGAFLAEIRKRLETAR
jgi:predicted nucleic acid-binding protein